LGKNKIKMNVKKLGEYFKMNIDMCVGVYLWNGPSPFVLILLNSSACNLQDLKREVRLVPPTAVLDHTGKIWMTELHPVLDEIVGPYL
jgi:hypothetical protein